MSWWFWTTERYGVLGMMGLDNGGLEGGRDMGLWMSGGRLMGLMELGKYSVGSGIRSLSLNEGMMGSCNTNDTLLARNVPSEQRHLNTSIIFDRFWAAMKRESLVIVEEDV